MIINAYTNKDKNNKNWFAHCSIYSFTPLIGHDISKIIKILQNGELFTFISDKPTIYIQLAI